MSTTTKAAAQAVLASITPAIATATHQAIANTASGLGGADASVIATEVAKETAAVVINQTNNEPWYQSRVTLGAILAALAGILGLFGWAFPAEVQGKVIDLIVALGPVIGAALALYGRWAARKPLGS
ncbi:hypothetical protein J2X65_003135 [Ancylobacter sp. 3268]|uniref:hypothetical protein n=1 Tax=Ancylobacter sp. 3268 TaxID=2817752 RepID=UPI002858874B|nr:hypothetical protein [Ancylobacter sp. 3268]MDR6953772.1 hypothetical protein [Ancylobacter sp. 3268]